MKSIFFGLGLFSFLLAVSLAEITSIDYSARTRRVLAKASDDRPAMDTLELPQLLQKFGKCWNQSDCSPKECCAGVDPDTMGACVHQPQLYEVCSPRIPPGSKICPCRVGLTCSTRKRRCVYITPDPDEVEESLLRDDSEGN